MVPPQMKEKDPEEKCKSVASSTSTLYPAKEATHEHEGQMGYSAENIFFEELPFCIKGEKLA